jgi:hypothetical protein
MEEMERAVQYELHVSDEMRKALVYTCCGAATKALNAGSARKQCLPTHSAHDALVTVAL